MFRTIKEKREKRNKEKLARYMSLLYTIQNLQKQGFTNVEIAKKLGIRESTIRAFNTNGE